MRPLTAQQTLQAWESGQQRSPLDRALLLLSQACPEESWEDLAALPVGRRDSRLLTLREWLFGPDVVCVTPCPECGHDVQLNFTIDQVRAGDASPPPRELSLETADHEVRFRLPNSLDVAALAGRSDEKAAVGQLLGRCLLAARCGGEEKDAGQLPAEVVDTIVHRMGEADPQADSRARLTCPSCSCSWDSVFDIVSFLWSEIEAWAVRTLREIHALASAYGWSESQVLAISPWRRQLYLQCVHS